MNTKTCCICGATKELSAFTKNVRNADGLQSQCSECRRALGAEYRKRNKNKVKYANARWKRNNRESNRIKVREWIAKNRDKRIEYNKRRAVEFPERFSATKKICRLINRGRIERGGCKICGKPKAEAHHFDYSTPLRVVWLCSAHHRAWHRLFGLNEPPINMISEIVVRDRRKPSEREILERGGG